MLTEIIVLMLLPLPITIAQVPTYPCLEMPD